MRTIRTNEQSGFFSNARRFVRIGAAAYSEWRRARADYRDLAHASDRMLKDIGLTRQQARFAGSRVNFAGILRDMVREEDKKQAGQETDNSQKSKNACDAMRKCCSQTC